LFASADPVPLFAFVMAPKRSSGSMGGDKKRARDDFSVKCEEVTSALKDAESLPEASREMLSVGVESALSRSKDDRHPYQAAVVTWVEEALGSIQASLEQRLAESKATVDGAEAENAKLQAAVTNAQENRAKLQDTMVDAEVKSSNLEIDAQEKADAFSEAKAAEESSGAEAEAVAGKKVELETLLVPDSQFAKWRCEAAEKKEVSAFVKMIKSKSKFEPVLLQSLVPTLLVAPEARTEFDKLVLHHFQQAVEKQVAAQVSSLEGTASTKATCVEAVAVAQAALDAAKTAAEAGAAAAAEADAAGQRAAVEVKAAEKSLREHGSLVKTASKDCKSAEAALEDFKSRPLAAFVELRDRTPLVDEPTGVMGAAESELAVAAAPLVATA